MSSGNARPKRCATQPFSSSVGDSRSTQTGRTWASASGAVDLFLDQPAVDQREDVEHGTRLQRPMRAASGVLADRWTVSPRWRHGRDKPCDGWSGRSPRVTLVQECLHTKTIDYGTAQVRKRCHHELHALVANSHDCGTDEPTSRGRACDDALQAAHWFAAAVPACRTPLDHPRRDAQPPRISAPLRKEDLMNLTISGHHLEVTPALREYVLPSSIA